MSMHREDELDNLLADRARGRALRSMGNREAVNHEIEPLLAAAARLDALHDAVPSRAFTADLEERLMARMSQLPAPAQPAQMERRSTRQANLFHMSPRIAWAAVAAALLLTIGLGAFTAKAAPGGPLYAVRQFAQTLAGQALPSPTVDPLATLAQARADLKAYDADIANADEASALVALRHLRSDDARAAAGIDALSDASVRQTDRSLLSVFRQSAITDLRTSFSALDWQGRAQVTDVLRVWGNTSLIVTQARILSDTSGSQSGKTPPGGATLLIEARGAGFVQGAQLLLNGQPVGALISLTPTRLLARLSASDVDAGSVVIGVENPDGTVAIASSLQRDDHSGPGAAATPGDHSGNHSGSSTGASRTPTPNDSSAG